MGSIKESEPPSKRIRLTLKGSDSYLQDLSPIQNFIAGSLKNLMARTLPLPSSQGNEETIGSKGLIKKMEFIKIITSALYSLGYEKSGAMLENESGILLHSTAVRLFMQQVLDGKWDESVATLHRIGLVDETVLKSASILILEQKFFEFLSAKKVMNALTTLRNDIAPLCTNSNTSRARDLASCIISPTQCEVLGVFNKDTGFAVSRSKTLERLQKLLPQDVMISEKRLANLVEQALEVQRDACAYHNNFDSELSLYSDHSCGSSHIPSQTLQILQEHSDEVWFVQFSHDGKYLASTSKDQSAAIWKVNENGEVSLKHRLHGHQKPVSTVLWSPDDRQLLTCGVEEVIRRWDVNSGECLHIYEKPGVGVISCEWFPNGEGIYSGMTDKSICVWDLNGGEIDSWRGHQTISISDMAITQCGKIISRCKETEISLFDRETKHLMMIHEEDVITSFSLSKDNKFLLVNLLNQQIHLWRIEGDPVMVSTYEGHKRERFLISSCFGGFEQSFIASGSEDSQVYIWHRTTMELLFVLPGHSGSVNCVSWNPVNLHMLASASDDRTIRIWGLNHVKPKHDICQSNGVIHHSNGTT